MDTPSRLRFLRSLHCLTQIEMARHADISRTYYALTESGKKKLPKQAAAVISKKFGVNQSWLLGTGGTPLDGTKLLLVVFPPPHLNLYEGKSHSSRLNQKSPALFPLLADFLAENPLNDFWLGTASMERRLALINFSNDQYLLICFNEDGNGNANYGHYSRMLVNHLPIPPKMVQLDQVHFIKIEQGSLTDILRFFDLCGISQKKQADIKNGSPKFHRSHYDLNNSLLNPARRELLERIVDNIDANDIRLSEIATLLEKQFRGDLIDTGMIHKT